jgi:hypothetical protein
MIVMFFAVQDTFSMDGANPFRRVKFVLNNQNGNLVEPKVSVMVYTYNPNVGTIDAGGFDLNALNGSKSSRMMNVYKGPLINQEQTVQKKSKLQRMSRRFAQPEIQQVFEEGYIQKIEIEDSRGVIYPINPQVIDVINKKLDDNPGKILTLRIMRLPSGSYAIGLEF